MSAVEEWVKKIRRGPHGSLYRTFDAIVPDSLDVSYLTRTDIRISARELGYAIVPDSLDDVSYVTRTDIRIIARDLGINLYEYFAGTSKRPARWEIYSGNMKGADRISHSLLRMGVVTQY